MKFLKFERHRNKSDLSWRSSKARYKQHGFTLIEVMVALVVVAIALSAIVSEVAQGLDNAVTLRERTFAHWVAMNKVAELQASHAWPAPGETKGEAEMADQEWYWSLKVIVTDDKQVRRIDVEVRRERDDDVSQAKLIAYLGQPV